MTRTTLALLLLVLCARADSYAGTWKNDKVTLVLAEGGAGLTGTVTLGTKSFAVTASVDAAGALSGTFQTPEGQSFAFTATLRAGNLVFKTGKNEFLLSKPADNPFDDLPDDPAPPPPAPPQPPPPAAAGGVGIQLYTDDNGQLVVQALAPDGPAAKAGVQQGDVILAVDDVPVPKGTLASQMTSLRGPVGSRVKLTVQRGAQKLDLVVVRDVLGGPGAPQPEAGFKHPSGLWRLVPPPGWDRGAGQDQNTVRWTHPGGALAFVTIIPQAPYRDGEEFFKSALGPGMQQAGAKFFGSEVQKPQGGPPLFTTRFERTRENVPESGRLLALVLDGNVILLQTTVPKGADRRVEEESLAFHTSFRIGGGGATPPGPPGPPAPPAFGRDVDRAIEEAEAAINGEQYERALNLLSPLATKGEPRAMFLLAYLLREGLGVRQAPGEAFKLYRSSAEAGFHPGMNLLGVCYREGVGTQQDFAEAMKWFKKSALLGNRDAALSVGALYVNGQGVQADYVEGYAWYLVSDVEMAHQNMQQLDQYLSQQQIRQAQQRAQQIAATIQPEGGAAGGFPAQIMRTDDGRYVIQGIKAGSNAEQAGVRPGDVLISVGGKRVTGIAPAELGALLEGAAGAILQMEIERDGQSVQLAFPRDAINPR